MHISKVIAEVDALLQAGEDAKAEESLREAVAECIEAEPDNIVGQSVLLNELGGYYRSRGVFDKGEAAYLQAKTLLEETREHTGVVYDLAAGSGCCAHSALNHDVPCCEDSNAEHQSHTEIPYANGSMTANYATTLNNLAGLYRMCGQLQRAVDTFDAAIQVYENCDKGVSPDYLASVYSNKGLVYLDMQNTDQARSMFLKAKEILERDGDYPFALGTTISNLGFASVIDKRVPEAITLFQAAKVLFEKAGNGDMVQNCEKLLSRLEAEQ